MADEMDEIINEFVTEAEETLERIDPLFIELETKGYDKDLLNEIFRGMHTLKGAAGFLGFQSIVDVAHRSESIMKKVRDREIQMTTPLMDVILKSVDALRLLISHIRLKDGVEEDVSALLKEQDTALENASSDQTQSLETTPDAVQSPEIRMESAEKPEPEPSAPVDPVVEQASPEKPQAPEHTAPKQKPHVQTITSAVDDAVQQTAKEKDVVANLRVDVSRIDKVMDLAGEIVLARNRLLNISSKLEITHGGDPLVENLGETTAFLDRVTSDLQLAVMKMRMQPIQKVFGKFPRMVRDMSRNLGKDIDLEIFGEDTEVDKSVIENIGDPLVHIIRNSIDHGLEFSDDRVAKGKPPKGRIVISAFQKGTLIVIEVIDDGKGIDLEVVKRKAINRGLITEEESQKMSEDALVNLIFLPGFSTKEVSTELSGRGVGMDVVKTNVAKLNGYVEVITKKDVGSTFRISLPLTLAILQAMMIKVGNEVYAVPQSMVEETIRIKKEEIKDITGQKVLTIRDRVLPMYDMATVLGVKNIVDDSKDYTYILVMVVGDRHFCISVDELIGQEEVVIKTINGIDSDECGILGATINGDGSVVLIIDLAVMARGLFATSSK
ncbi:MAG: chemotaxis protein CheA [Dissulfurispiraceae bacterium]|jgi:two-component system chemotaxis sensor kinase CheA|nr:chemotaxis protein CheA [Dissulfurispiraceae bacterium]